MTEKEAEKKYVDALNVVYSDSIKTLEEARQLEELRIQYNIPESRAIEIEKKFVETHGFDGTVKTYSTVDRSNEVLNDVGKMAKESLDAGNFPFNKRPPYESNLNVISGSTLDTIQTLALEMKTAMLANKMFTNKWIWGADAAALDLVLDKSKREGNLSATEPISIFASVKQRTMVENAYIDETNVRNEGLRIDGQCAYMLDQFTPESINKALNTHKFNNQVELNNEILSPSQIDAKKQEILVNLNKTSKSDDISQFREECRKNLEENLIYKKNEIQEENAVIAKKHLQFGNMEEWNCFSTVRNYFLMQHGCSVKNDKRAPDAAFKKMIDERGTKYFALMLFSAQASAEHLVHYEFSYEAQYNQAEKLRGESRKKLPVAFKTIISDSQAQKYKKFNRAFTPKQKSPTHTRSQQEQMGY